MDCERCRDQAVNEIEENLGYVEHVQANQGWVVLLLLIFLLVLALALFRKGVLEPGDLVPRG